MEFTNETFYGNENETYYVDQFSRVWLVQSVDFSEAKEAQLQSSLPEGLEELSFSITSDIELTDNIFELPESAKEEVTKEAKKDAQLFVDEFNEPLNPAETDWDSEGFNNCQFSFHTNDTKTYDESWSLYQSTLVAETKLLCADSDDWIVIATLTGDAANAEIAEGYETDEDLIATVEFEDSKPKRFYVNHPQYAGFFAETAFERMFPAYKLNEDFNCPDGECVVCSISER